MLQLGHDITEKSPIRFLKDRNWMRLSDFINDYVAFICEGNLIRGGQAGGTAFFVEMPSQDGNGDHCYIVTARHVIDELKESTSPQVYMRINMRSKKREPIDAAYVGIPFDRWHYHQDESVDVAAALWNPFLDSFPYDSFPEFETIPIGMLADDEFIHREHIGIGDLIFYPGLFHSHQETKRNIPVVRQGHIAAMPDEPIIDRKRGPFEAYIADAFSIGGFSGSPVFIAMYSRNGPAYSIADYRRLRSKEDEDYDQKIRSDQPMFTSVLGVLTGHFPHEQGYGTINSGLSFIVPAKKIVELVNQEKVMSERKRVEKKHPKGATIERDSGFSVLSHDEFHDALKKASKKRVPPGKGNS